MHPKFLNTLNINIRATLHHDTNIKNFEYSELSLKSNDFFNRANVAIFDTKKINFRPHRNVSLQNQISCKCGEGNIKSVAFLQASRRCSISSRRRTASGRHFRSSRTWPPWTCGTASVCVSSTRVFWSSCASITLDGRGHCTTWFTAQAKIPSPRYFANYYIHSNFIH